MAGDVSQGRFNPAGELASLRKLQEFYSETFLKTWPRMQAEAAQSAQILAAQHQRDADAAKTAHTGALRQLGSQHSQWIQRLNAVCPPGYDATTRDLQAVARQHRQAGAHADHRRLLSDTEAATKAVIDARANPHRPIDYKYPAIGMGVISLILIFNAPLLVVVVLFGVVMGFVYWLNQANATEHKKKDAALLTRALALAGETLAAIDAADERAQKAETASFTARNRALFDNFQREAKSQIAALQQQEQEALQGIGRWKTRYAAAAQSCSAPAYDLTAELRASSIGAFRDWVLVGQKHLPSVPSIRSDTVRDIQAVAAQAKVPVSFTQKVLDAPPAPHLHRLISGKALLIHRAGGVDNAVASAVNAMLLRALSQVPPGKVLFTFVDPVAQGQNAARLLSLGDFDDRLVNVRVWTDRDHIRQRLRDLTAHIENVIQKYLRTEFATIDDYNVKAKEIAEPYRVLTVFDFPEKFDDESAAELRRIIQNGPRCGVLTIVVNNTTTSKNAYGPSLGGAEPFCDAYDVETGGWVQRGSPIPGFIRTEQSPAEAVIKVLIARVGVAAKESFKVEVPFDKMLELARADGMGRETWRESAANRLHIPLGRTGANKVQYLKLGVETSQHALVAGQSGSGKSNLLHVIIASAAKLFSPQELQLYLIDFKTGVEFQPYADALLPHARVLSVASEREFGLSVLSALAAEMDKRNAFFSSSGVRDLTGFRQRYPTKLMPRILLLVDEFQEFFTPDDALSHKAGQVLDHLVRMGRNAGIHVMLGSQTLAGTSAPRATLNLMTVRIALKCGEADSQIILAEGNSAARRLSRPGEGIYNASNGLVEGNDYFQVARFKDDDLDRVLADVKKFTAERFGEAAPRPVVFKSFEQADITSAAPLLALLSGRSAGTPHDTWLGEPIALDPPVAAEFNRESGRSLLIVHQTEAEGMGVVYAALLGLAAQPSQAKARFEIVDFAQTDSDWQKLLDPLAGAFGGRFESHGRKDVARLMVTLAKEVEERQNGKPATTPIFLTILGLHRARTLRYDNDEHDDAYGNPALGLDKILKFGPEVAVHVIAWIDMYSIDRTLDSRQLREFGMRCAGPLDSRGSDRLFDSDAATGLGRVPHRMVFADSQRTGIHTVFRPYAVPNADWIRAFGAKLKARTPVR